MKKSNLLLITFLVTAGFFLSSCNTHYENQYVFETDSGFIKLQIIDTNIIRIVISPEKELKERKSLMIADYPQKNVTWEMTETYDTLEVSTGYLTARLCKKDNTVSFFDRHGNLLLEGDSSVFTPATVSGEAVYNIRQKFNLSPDEAIYGLGQYQDGIMNWRDHDVTLFQENTVAVNPMFVSTRNYGVLWDNYSLTKFHDGDDGTSLSSRVADAIDYYVFAGSDLDDIISGYRYLTGKAPMFGRWAYGYWQSKERYKTQYETTGTVREYRKRGIPLDNIVQDWYYWGDLGWNALEFDTTRFPDSKGMIDSVHQMHAHIMISVWPNFGKQTRIYKEMKDRGFLITGQNGQDRGLYDPYNPAARNYYWEWINRNMFSKGMDAWWLDATEPEVPGKTLKEKVHAAENLGNNALGTMARYLNAYSLMTTKGVYENQRKSSGKKRVFILTRSAYAGQQRYGAVTWSGDIHAQWDVFRNQISAGLNFCMAGIPYWTTDIGAFFPDNPLGNRDNAYRELYLRWFQFGVFSPVFRSHGTGTAREIYNFGGENSWTWKPLLKFDNFRYRLLPYIYSQAWQVTSNDYTIMRGLVFDFGNDTSVYDLDNEYMFGPAFLVTPVTKQMYHEHNYTGVTIPVTNLYDPQGQKGRLSAEFYNGTDFDTLAATAYIRDLDINWNDGSSRPEEVRAGHYSIRLTGEILAPESGKYTFVTTSNDGIRIKINDQVVVENWTGHGVTIDMGDISLEKGKRYRFTVEYFQLLGNAITRIAWILPSVSDTLKEKRIPPVQSEKVYLPAGAGWFDFWRGTYTEGGQTVEVPAPLDEIPLFVKAGTIVPLGPVMHYADERPCDTIELRIYPGADTEFILYEDENDNYNYEKGVYATIPITWIEKDQELTIGKRNGRFPGMLKERIFNIVWVCDGHGIGVMPDGEPDRTVRFTGNKLVIRKD